MAGEKAQQPPLGCNVAYLCSWNFLIKIFEIVTAVITLVFSLSYNGSAPIVIIQIVSAMTVATPFFWVVMYIISLNRRFPEFFDKIVFTYNLLTCVCMIICTICAGFLIPQFKAPVYIICIATSTVCALLFLIDTIISLLALRGGPDVVTYPCSPVDAEVTLN